MFEKIKGSFEVLEASGTVIFAAGTIYAIVSTVVAFTTTDVTALWKLALGGAVVAILLLCYVIWKVHLMMRAVVAGSAAFANNS